jgi:hypothetical protein
MSTCEQTTGLSILQHGESVRDHLFDLLSHLRTNSELQNEWKFPDWLLDNQDLILSNLPDDQTLNLYTVYHDIGKPFCLTIDQDGRRHFPDHAQKSYEIFSNVFDNEVAADLILHDMDVHLLKADGVEEFAKSTNSLTLLLVGLSEIHANAKMFGGIESTSFKIKWKSLNQRGKQIINIKKNKQLK